MLLIPKLTGKWPWRHFGTPGSFWILLKTICFLTIDARKELLRPVCIPSWVWFMAEP